MINLKKVTYFASRGHLQPLYVNSRSFGDVSVRKCNSRVTYRTLACHIVLLALTIVTFGVVIARHVPWVNLLCLTKAIYHVVNKYETNEPQLIIAMD